MLTTSAIVEASKQAGPNRRTLRRFCLFICGVYVEWLLRLNAREACHDIEVLAVSFFSQTVSY